MIRFSRLALVPAATLVFGTTLLSATPAQAAACYGGTPFTNVATGRIDGTEFDYWQTEATGPTSITLVSTHTGTDFHAFTEDCVSLCSATAQCVTDYEGTISIYVHQGRGDYALFARSVDGPTGTTQPGTCNIVNTLGVCVGIWGGDFVDRVTVYGVAPGSGSEHVVGAIDTYSFPLPTGGTVTVPCVVLFSDEAGSNACAAAGGTFVARSALLVDQTVPLPAVGTGAPILTVGICEALITVTVNGFGINGLGGLTVC